MVKYKLIKKKTSISGKILTFGLLLPLTYRSCDCPVIFLVLLPGRLARPHQVSISWGAVLVGAEANQPPLVQHDPQRAHRGHQDVDPEVELEAVDEERVGHVALHHGGLLLFFFLSHTPGGERVTEEHAARLVGCWN